MELIGIGEAARKLGVNASTLRYYEDRGLVRPAVRRAGRRMYGPEQLRRLAFLQLMQKLGMSLDSACAILDEPGGRWRDEVHHQIAELDRLIARAESARFFLRHTLECTVDHPTRECSSMIETLDRRLAGVPFEDLAVEHGQALPPEHQPPPGGLRRRHT
ncbi:MerR family transcriptional regulator [Streptomyces sp. NPDC093094]|uniref:MerR family transcriptional regulator n=1 Tax=Streptomyces sp. NPDC093094 TaxID=3366026 RepID=UPI0038081823